MIIKRAGLLEHLIDDSSNPTMLLWDKHHLVSINLFSQATQTEISGPRTNIRAFEHQFPEDECDGEKSDHGISQEEPHNTPATFEEQVVPSRQEHEESSAHSHVRRVWLEPAFVRECVSKDALLLQ